jgi:hypothetical protein
VGSDPADAPVAVCLIDRAGKAGTVAEGIGGETHSTTAGACTHQIQRG